MYCGLFYGIWYATTLLVFRVRCAALLPRGMIDATLSGRRFAYSLSYTRALTLLSGKLRLGVPMLP